jgi:hypothetical protein
MYMICPTLQHAHNPLRIDAQHQLDEIRRCFCGNVQDMFPPVSYSGSPEQ